MNILYKWISLWKNLQDISCWNYTNITFINIILIFTCTIYISWWLSFLLEIKISRVEYGRDTLINNSDHRILQINELISIIYLIIIND